ncbi:unnamed protein product [Urochloa humidicola]
MEASSGSHVRRKPTGTATSYWLFPVQVSGDRSLRMVTPAMLASRTARLPSFTQASGFAQLQIMWQCPCYDDAVDLHRGSHTHASWLCLLR